MLKLLHNVSKREKWTFIILWIVIIVINSVSQLFWQKSSTSGGDLKFVGNRWLSEIEIMQGDIYCCLIQGKRSIRREHMSQGEQSRARAGGIKGGRDCFLWCVFPQGQKGGSGLLPWQIWRCPVLLFLWSPSSCRKQHHAGHQSLGKHWPFSVLSTDVMVQ